MLALPDAQACLMDALLERSGSAAAAALLRRNSRPTALQRLQIYRNNLFESLLQALNDVYPVVVRLVGEAFFRSAARTYIRAHPSRSANLHDFGADLAGFLRAYNPAAGLPYLPDVAALEWAIHRVYHEAELTPLDPRQLAAVPLADQTELHLELQPCARFVSSRFPVLGIWQANQAQEDGMPISLGDGGADLLVVQHDLEIEFRHLRRAESRWLRTLAGGASLAAATAAAVGEEPGFDLAATLARHFGSGLFTNFWLPRPSRRWPA